MLLSSAPDQTRGLLAYIEREYPGAFHPEVRTQPQLNYPFPLGKKLFSPENSILQIHVLKI